MTKTALWMQEPDFALWMEIQRFKAKPVEATKEQMDEVTDGDEESAAVTPTEVLADEA